MLVRYRLTMNVGVVDRRKAYIIGYIRRRSLEILGLLLQEKQADLI